MAKKKNIKGVVFGAAVLVLVGLVVFLGLQKKQSVSADRFMVGVPQEPDTLHPLFSQTMVSTEVQGLLFEGMVEYDDEWRLNPRIVESIPTLENGGLVKLSGNRIQTTWKLKEGIKWSDGWPITVEDFIFAYKVIMDNRVPVVSRDMENRIEKMEAPDPRTLVVTWKEPYAYTFLGHSFLPKHILEASYLKDPEKFHEHEYNRNPLGNGPYVLKEWKPGAYVSASQNPNYYGDKPQFQNIIYKFTGGTTTLESDIVTRNIDAISPTGTDLSQILDFEKRKGNEFQFGYVDGMVWEHIDFNVDEPRFQDKRVRQALLYGLNREEMVQRLFAGKQSVAHSWLPPKHYGYDANVKKYPYDPEKAKELLEEAGWKVGPNGVRINKKGEKLSFILMTTAGNKVREDIQQLIQEDWKKIGVKIEIQNQPAKVLFGDTLNKRKYKHLLLYALVYSPISDGESGWTSKNIPSAKNNWQGQNTTGWRNSEIDVIDSQVPVTLEEEKRKELLKKEQVIWVEELPALPLFWRADVTVIRKGIENWKPTGTSTPVTWNVEYWRPVAE